MGLIYEKETYIPDREKMLQAIKQLAEGASRHHTEAAIMGLADAVGLLTRVVEDMDKERNKR